MKTVFYDILQREKGLHGICEVKGKRSKWNSILTDVIHHPGHGW